MQPRKVNYLFVDGGYLREVIGSMSRMFFKGIPLSIDYASISRGFTKSFYYDCLAPRRKGESSEDYARRSDLQREDFHSLRMVDGWHVFEGVLAGDGVDARQKQVDIQIAVDMLTHAYRRNMEELDFIAGDQDFKPLIDALVRDGMYVRLWYEAKSASRELVRSVDARRQLDIYAIHNFMTPEFRDAWPLPSRNGQPGKMVLGWTLIGKGEGKQQDVEIWQNPTTKAFQITHIDSLNRGYYHHMHHADLAFLKLCYESVFGVAGEAVVWKNVA